MRALLVEKSDEGDVTSSIKDIDESQLPEGDVTVAIEYSTVNYKDGLCITGGGGLVRNYPHIPGIDFAGTVESSSDERYKKGDAVVLTGWRVGEVWWGGYAQKACVKADWLVPLPQGLSTKQAMAVGTAGLTAMLAINALEDHGLKPDGGEVLVTGAAGGVGSVATAILANLAVAAVTGRPETEAYLKDLGAARIIAREELSETTKRPLEKESWAGCVDAVGGSTLARVLGQLQYGGSVAAVGLAGGAALPATVIPFLLRGVNLLGIDSVMRPYDDRIRAWKRIASDLPMSKLEAMINDVTLDDLPALGQEILRGQVQGRTVVANLRERLRMSALDNSNGDQDPIETAEWIEALEALAAVQGPKRAQFVLSQLQDRARLLGVSTSGLPFSAYRNTIPVSQQPAYPGDIEIEQRLNSLIRWNALAMVVRANKAYGELGGHIATYASAAELLEVGFNHFFKARTADFCGDIVYTQAHCAPAIYARSYLEGRLSETDIINFRQEVPGKGLSSYPHPWLMDDYWQIPGASMGLAAMSAVSQARFLKYLGARQLADTKTRHVWGFFGDGEMDEPESVGGLTLAAREKLDNLTFVVNCNLQRLDGPVRGNGQIIQEFEALFVGAGWNVIKVLWGSEWDELFARDKNNVLLRRFAETVDGEYQNLGSKDGDYNRAKFFDIDPESARLVQHMSQDDIHKLKRGGHDVKKIYAAFAAAKAHKGQPTVILAKTKKGFGMGDAGESRMIAHQAKKLDLNALFEFRDRFKLPLTDEQVEKLEFYRPSDNSSEISYLRQCRTQLGGSIPKRYAQATTPAPKRPVMEVYAKFALETDGREMSTTMAIVRMLSGLLRDKQFGPRIVPIVADEARTFGMDNLFRQVGIYSTEGQLYEPEDKSSMLFYKESQDGQLIQEGINEASAISTWTTAATAYSIHDVELLPFYIFYSIFGFQRVGDQIWAAADQRARGFLLGATAGRTTLSGEGLQHQDGSSHLLASTVPNCRAYDPSFAFEVAVILDYGMKRMMEDKHDEFFYLTVMNENYAQPSMPSHVKSDDIIKGMYKFKSHELKDAPRVRLVGAGTIINEVIAAAEMLATDYGVESDIFSATSFNELARDANSTERQNRLNARSKPSQSYVQTLLEGDDPVVVATDYVRALPQQITPFVKADMTILGTDGFGRSANRKALRRFFEVDRAHIVVSALSALMRRGQIEPSFVEKAIKKLGIDINAPAPWTV